MMALGLPPEGSSRVEMSRVPAECLECGRENFEVVRFMTSEMVPRCPKCGGTNTYVPTESYRLLWERALGETTVHGVPTSALN